MGTRRSDDILHANAKPRAADGALPRGLEDSLAGLEALPPTPTLPRKGGGRKDEGGEGERTRRAEALGSATDIWAAYREGAFRPSSRPFLGYLMLLEDSERSRSPVKVIEPHFRVFPEFRNASYRNRYAILIEKLLRDRLYDGACFLLSHSAAAVDGNYIEPHPELTFAKFVTPLIARVSAICSPRE